MLHSSQPVGVRQRVVARGTLSILLVLGASILVNLVPAPAVAHPGHFKTARGHFEQDSVVHTPAIERRLERRTARVTSKDVASAKRGVPRDPGQVGDWGPVVHWPVVGVHVAASDQREGPRLRLGGRQRDRDLPRLTTSPGPPSGIRRAASRPRRSLTGFNIFCSGLAHLMDGSLFAAGGNKDSALNGIRQTHTFNASTNTWTRAADMAFERWYPSVTPLRDGEMLITEGGPDMRRRCAQTNGSSARSTSASLNLPLYPWLDVAPDGRAFYSGPDQTMRSLNPSGTGSWQSFGQRDSVNRDYGSRAMYDIGKILVAGGGASTRSARVIDLNGATPHVDGHGANGDRPPPAQPHGAGGRDRARHGRATPPARRSSTSTTASTPRSSGIPPPALADPCDRCR